MATAAQPLLALSQTRIQDESRLAAAIAAGDSRYRQRTVRLVLLSIAEYAVGLSTVGLSLHINGGDLAQVVLYAGLLVALCGPIWTILLALWLEENH
jgi:hypothetical protein